MVVFSPPAVLAFARGAPLCTANVGYREPVPEGRHESNQATPRFSTVNSQARGFRFQQRSLRGVGCLRTPCLAQ
jgi:hypothetical protein